jgi:hypothetical protein
MSMERRSGVSSPVQPIQLQVQLTPDDYAGYFAAVGKRQSTWVNFAIFGGAFCVAIPVAFAARALAALETADRAAIELVGLVSLLSFFAGLITFILAASIQRRRAIAGALSGTPNTFDPKTIVLDEDAVSIIGKLSHVKWTWPAFSRLTTERGLMLLWIGPQNAVVVPDRAFADPEARDSAIAFARARLVPARP